MKALTEKDECIFVLVRCLPSSGISISSSLIDSLACSSSNTISGVLQATVALLLEVRAGC